MLPIAVSDAEAPWPSTPETMQRRLRTHFAKSRAPPGSSAPCAYELFIVEYYA